MPIQTLYRAGALGGGANLWLIPHIEESKWSRLIDWYLNFQITLARRHRPRELPEKLKAILQENDVAPLTFSIDQGSCLMVASENRLPNSQVVELPLLTEGQSWVTQAHRVWVNLGKPSLRVFLPSFLAPGEFAKFWPEEVKKAEISLVPHEDKAGGSN